MLGIWSDGEFFELSRLVTDSEGVACLMIPKTVRIQPLYTGNDDPSLGLCEVMCHRQDEKPVTRYPRSSRVSHHTRFPLDYRRLAFPRSIDSLLLRETCLI